MSHSTAFADDAAVLFTIKATKGQASALRATAMTFES